jgi:hypothetical protein
MPLGIETAVAQERSLDAVARRSAEQQHERERGVRWSGCGPDPVPGPRSEAQLREAAAARLARLQAWRASAKGRLSAAVSQAQRAAERAHAAADAALGALARGETSFSRSCRDAADVIEAQGRDLIATACATREALRIADRTAPPGP